MRTPCIQASSPTLTTAVSSCVVGVRSRSGELAQAEQLLHAEQESGAADAADQNGDLHTDRHLGARVSGDERGRGKHRGARRNISAMLTRHARQRRAEIRDHEMV